MKTIILLISIISIFLEPLTAQKFLWKNKIGGTGQANPFDVIQDKSGNYYVYGNFNGELKMDTITINAVNLQDIFLAKYSPKGQLMWLKTIAGTGTENTYGIKLSKDGNYIYLSGVFSSIINVFHQSTLYNNGGLDIFLTKIDLNGNVIWAKNVAYGSNHQMGGYFDIDMYNNIIMVGNFINDITFFNDFITLIDPTPEFSVRQGFIVKFNEDGYPIWANMFYSKNINNNIRNITITGNEYYVSGQVSGVLEYKNIPIINVSNNRNGAIIKIYSNGDFAWSRKIVASNNAELYVIKHISDEIGNQYVTGRFNSQRITFDSTLTDTSKKLYLNHSLNKYDIFIAKYNSAGVFQWAKVYGSTQDENVTNINYNFNNIMISGSYNGSFNFGNFIVNHKQQSDAFLGVLNTEGQEITFLKGNGKLNDYGYGSLFSTTSRNYVWIGNFYSDSLYFDNNDFLINDLPNKLDGFVVRYGCFDSISIVLTKPSCPNANNGSITVIPSFGNEPYSYLWSNGQTTATISNLSVGNYNVTVVGSDNCELVKTIHLDHVPLLQAEIINVQHINCFGGSTGSATANPKNGSAPYTYKWSNGKTTQTITNLPAGIYTVTIRDACNNTATASVVINQNSKVNATVSSTPTTCNGGNDGTATAYPYNGQPPYTYKWSNGQTTQTATNLIGGNTYKVTVKDGCFQSVVKTITIPQPVALNATVTTYASSPCVPTGIAIVTAYNGTPPYSYKWNTGSTNDTIFNCSPNTTYQVTVTDACNGSKAISKTVGSKVISITPVVTCTPAGTCQGSIKANVTGGDPPYTYQWSNLQTTQTAINLCKGYYNVTIKDANGCTKTRKNIYVPICTKSFTNEDENNKENNILTEKINIYPNPAKNYIIIKLPVIEMDKNYNIEIYNYLGQQIQNFSLTNQDHETYINTSLWNDGIYFIRIRNEDTLYENKFIINKK